VRLCPPLLLALLLGGRCLEARLNLPLTLQLGSILRKQRGLEARRQRRASAYWRKMDALLLQGRYWHQSLPPSDGRLCYWPAVSVVLLQRRLRVRRPHVCWQLVRSRAMHACHR
jgi:hypothetical protein